MRWLHCAAPAAQPRATCDGLRDAATNEGKPRMNRKRHRPAGPQCRYPGAAGRPSLYCVFIQYKDHGHRPAGSLRRPAAPANAARAASRGDRAPAGRASCRAAPQHEPAPLACALSRAFPCPAAVLAVPAAGAPASSSLNPALLDLHPQLWRSSELGQTVAPLPVQRLCARLDAELPGGGWPTRARSPSCCSTQPGCGEWRLLAPGLAPLTRGRPPPAADQSAACPASARPRRLGPGAGQACSGWQPTMPYQAACGHWSRP